MTETKSHSLPKRDELDPRYKWKLEDIYESNDKWEEDLKKVKLLSDEVVQLKGTLGQSAANLLKCLSLCDNMMSLYDRIYVYARMRRDENNAEHVYQALTDRASALGTEAYAAVSFMAPEIISIPE